MTPLFPKHNEEWKRQVEALILCLEHDVQSIQKTMPMIPDPELGNAYTGPTSPVEFNQPRRAEQSGSPATT